MEARAMPGDGLDRMFRARSIALVGASSDPTKTGGRPISLLKRHGFAGTIYPVNPKGGTIQDLPAYKNVGDLPHVPDLAVVAVPGRGAVDAVRDCARKGIRSAIVLSAGFAEQGPEGAALQTELQRIAGESGMRILGPNCLGAVGVPERVIGTFSIALETEMPISGPVAIVSQSGNIGSVAMKLLGQAGAGISRFMATGNECDIDVADGIAWLARDPATSVILCCMETCRHPDRLTSALDGAREAGKPVIVLKIGASEAGQAAALSHTGGLAGGDRVFDAVFARHGAVRVRSLERLVELGSAAAALGDRRTGASPSVVAVAASGGFGIMMADAASAAGLRMNPVSPDAAARIKAVLPLAATANPVDATAQMSANPEILEELLSALLEDEANEVVCMMMALGLDVPRLRGIYLDAFRRLTARFPERCLVACVAGPADAVAELNRMGVICFPTIEATFEGIAALAKVSDAHDAKPRACLPTRTRRVDPSSIGRRSATRSRPSASLRPRGFRCPRSASPGPKGRLPTPSLASRSRSP
jgi:acyl-CoA synthetase (NDP forming)